MIRAIHLHYNIALTKKRYAAVTAEPNKAVYRRVDFPLPQNSVSEP